jgi:hypothetical protein
MYASMKLGEDIWGERMPVCAGILKVRRDLEGGLLYRTLRSRALLRPNAHLASHSNDAEHWEKFAFGTHSKRITRGGVGRKLGQ